MSSVQSQPPPQPAAGDPGATHRGVCAMGSANALRATVRAMELIRTGRDSVDAVVAGVNIIEDDPTDSSVGLGGLPNEQGIVELDASCMHGPTHKAGAVAALRNIRNPASVALAVLRRTDHVLIVGEGALRFALAHGFKEENLLTEEARKAWLKWKENLSPEDDWLNDDQRDAPADSSPSAMALPGEPGLRADIPFTWGTVHCGAVNEEGNLGAVTSTSGLSYKIPGRVGDSPIIGAGLYVDNAVGSAGATGRGEAVIANCGAFSIVREMDRGLTPTEACLAVLRRIAANTREKRLLDPQGRPNFQVTFYALRKDGAYGSASMWNGASFAAHEGVEAKVWPCPSLFER